MILVFASIKWKTFELSRLMWKSKAYKTSEPGKHIVIKTNIIITSVFPISTAKLGAFTPLASSLELKSFIKNEFR